MSYVNGNILLGCFPTQTLGATFNSGSLRVADHVLVNIYLKWAGSTPVGSFKIQVSNDSDDTPSNWEDLSGTTVAVTNDGSNMWNINNTGFRWMRIVYTRTSGSATISVATYTGKSYAD